MRIGHGYDVHRLVEGRDLILGGVNIPYEKGLLGHSDADVLTHAVMDALLGAAALGDIGKHFPDTDPAYKGANSLGLAEHVAALLREHGYRIGMATSTGYNSAMEHLERTNMLSYFSPNAIITGDMVENGKPAPDIYLLAAERLGVDPSECIGVEDSLNGVRAIHAAGMRAVMIPDIVEPTPEVEALAWKRCEGLLDIISLLQSE